MPCRILDQQTREDVITDLRTPLKWIVRRRIDPQE